VTAHRRDRQIRSFCKLNLWRQYSKVLGICFNTNAASNQVPQNMFRGKVSFAGLPTGVFMTVKESKPIKVKAF
jgi:hypothetical protein